MIQKIVALVLAPVSLEDEQTHLDVLQTLYGTILIPLAVDDEIVVAGAGKPGAADVQAATWMTVLSVQNTALVAQLQPDLYVGEAESVALAIEQQADLLLMDEQQGRSIAASYDVTYIGLLGVLLVAKSKGLLPAIKPLLDALRQDAGFWMSDLLCQHVLDAAGE